MVVPLNRATLISVKHSAPDNSTKGQLQALGQKPPHKQTLPLVHEQREAGLPPDCRPHGLRKTFGRLLADAGATAHETMAALSHLTLAEAERYTREADRSGGRRSIVKLEDHKANRIPQTSSDSLGKLAKTKGNSK
jgi:integrase